MYKNVPGSFIPNSPNLETTQMPMNSRVWENTVYKYSTEMKRDKLLIQFECILERLEQLDRKEAHYVLHLLQLRKQAKLIHGDRSQDSGHPWGKLTERAPWCLFT